jgi:hypothetical protein
VNTVNCVSTNNAAPLYLYFVSSFCKSFATDADFQSFPKHCILTYSAISSAACDNDALSTRNNETAPHAGRQNRQQQQTAAATTTATVVDFPRKIAESATVERRMHGVSQVISTVTACALLTTRCLRNAMLLKLVALTATLQTNHNCCHLRRNKRIK